jgi:D-3-phosphoglycerate dehydrogenase
MYKILICDQLPEVALDTFRADSKYEINLEYDLNQRDLAKNITPYHALIVRSATTVDQSIIDAGENLKVIGRAGSGLDNIDVAYARKKGIAVYNTPGSNSQAVAELTIGLLLSLSRNLYRASAGLKSGRWEKSMLKGHEISGKTLGLIGFGQIGQKVGMMATGLNMNILVYKTKPVMRSPGFEFEIVQLKTLLKKSDYVSLHVPLNEQSKNMIGTKELQLMQPHAYIINCSRGGIVNEGDLLQALENDIISGAGIDVYDKEPPLDFALINHPKTITTPHIGAATVESQERVGQDIAMAIMNYLEENYLFL